MSEELKLEKCYVLREKEIFFKDLKEGDIFRLGCDGSYSIACDCPKRIKLDGRHVVISKNVSIIESNVTLFNFKERLES